LLKYVELNWSAEDIAKIMGTTKNAIVGKMETLRKQKVTTLRLNGRRQT
jgi:predicted ArsR family transcriptional regulator